MRNYKVTNLKTDAVEYLNYGEVLNRKSVSKDFYIKYSYEFISNTPIQDKLNKVVHSTLDVLMYFTIAIALGVLTLEILTNLI
tara:strand:+ start:749 stop:997 length:249 start_codon:yes stop_codon:yes gene_type:complete